MTAIAAPASSAGSFSGAIPASPKATSSGGSACAPTRSATARSAALASTKTARTRRLASLSAELGHRLAEADRPTRLPRRVEAQVALREEQHDGRAEHEAAHLLASFQR